MISDNIMEAALVRIAATDDLAAELHMRLEHSEFRAKAVKDAIFLREEGSVTDRQAKAGTHADYVQAMENYFNALQAYESLRNERARKFAVIECWRSWSSARTKGLIT